MRHLEVLVEEPSAFETLDRLLPQLIGQRATHAVRDFGSKTALLSALPARLRGYHRQIARGDDLAIVVLLDEDRDKEGCAVLKSRLETMARGARLATKSSPDADGRFRVVNRIVVEELEAWFLGDIAAIQVEHGRVPPTLDRRSGFRDPDKMQGGTWEQLHRVLRQHGYYRNAFPKIEFARKVAPHLVPERNRSRSFKVFCEGIEALLT